MNAPADVAHADDEVVAFSLSPGLGDGQTQAGGFAHEGELGELSALSVVEIGWIGSFIDKVLFGHLSPKTRKRGFLGPRFLFTFYFYCDRLNRCFGQTLQIYIVRRMRMLAEKGLLRGLDKILHRKNPDGQSPASNTIFPAAALAIRQRSVKTRALKGSFAPAFLSVSLNSERTT
jgi:hypothetical protein